MESYIQNIFANRIGGSKFGKDTQIYKFEKIKRAKRAAMTENPKTKLIDMGVGEPDWMADSNAIKCLYEEAQKWENRGYSDNGIIEFKKAASNYMETVFNVHKLNPETEINHGIGSKPILALLPLAFIDPGDITILTVPGYPVIGTTTKALGGEVVELPLLEENDFYPDFSSLTEDQLKKAKLIYINYPNNPTGAVATHDFYKKVIDFARQHNIIVVSDEAYSALVFDNEKPLSFLNIKGAKDVGISVQSLSKAFNMTGWRLAFVAGNELIVKAFATVKDNNDSGQFAAIQHAGIYCLEHSEITEKTAAKYSRRHDMLIAVLRKSGFTVNKPKGSFYLYVKIPKATTSGINFKTAEDFSQYLIKEKLISTVPWDDAGAYVRFSVTFIAKNQEEEKKVINEIEKRLGTNQFIF